MKYAIVLICLVVAACSGNYKGSESKEKPPRKVRIAGDSTLETGWYYVLEDTTGFPRKLGNDTTILNIDPNPIVVAADVEYMEVGEDMYGRPSLNMKLDEEAAEWWRQATGNSIGRRFAFIVEDKLMVAPTVMGEIPNGMSAMQSGEHTKEQLEAIMKKVME